MQPTIVIKQIHAEEMYVLLWQNTRELASRLIYLSFEAAEKAAEGILDEEINEKGDADYV